MLTITYNTMANATIYQPNLTSLSTYFPSLLHLRTSPCLLHTILNILNCRNPEISQKSFQRPSQNPVKNPVHLGKPTRRSYQPIRVGPMNSELSVPSPQVSYPKRVKWMETDNAAEQVRALPPDSKKPPPLVVQRGFRLS